MKYLVFLFLSVSFLVEAQYQFDFPVEGGVWEQYYIEPFQVQQKYQTYRDSVGSDTLLGGVLYKKIYRQISSSYERIGANDYIDVRHNWNQFETIGAMREDSLGVITFINLENEEYIVGDSSSSQSIIMTEVSIATAIIGFEHPNGLYCYKENGEVLYGDCSELELILGYNETIKPREVSINQTEYSVVVNSNAIVRELVVVSLDGRILSRLVGEGNQIVIPIKGLDKGMSLIQLETNFGDRVVEKIWVD